MCVYMAENILVCHSLIRNMVMENVNKPLLSPNDKNHQEQAVCFLYILVDPNNISWLSLICTKNASCSICGSLPAVDSNRFLIAIKQC